ncbi:MAG: hypothetical protein A3K19_02140 [Lentisphaerae bacterium RIFOXYB12_FULL_65_16]|nr:MAG: hypothetical protein A3K18_25360 [Lentisphaerae bacterium RIFOXYA12_64_32]OGV92598.1 MAG: hypothetical protein A3K19_02140 [Lentisphaerae bacterium RIFOXYB12_FULL_65_16]
MRETQSLRDAFFARGFVTDCPVYDMHGHMGPWPGSSLPRCAPEDMAYSMERAGVAIIVFCHHAALMSPDIGNRANIDAVRRFPNYFRAYCAVNGNYPDVIARDLKAYDRYPDVFVGFKFLADYHRVALTDARVRKVWEFANERKLLVLMHTWGGSAYNGPGQVAEIAAKYPQVTLLMGHSCHGEWDKAAELAKKFSNVYLELTAVLDDRGVLEMFVRKAGSEKILFGTDSPWFNHHHHIGAVLGAEMTDDDRRNIFHRNARRLLAPFLPRDWEKRKRCREACVSG